MARACHDEHLYASVLRATGGLVLPMRGSSVAHDKAEDHKSERACTREQHFGYAAKRNCLLEMLRNGSTFLSKSCAATPFVRVGLCVFQQIFDVLVVDRFLELLEGSAARADLGGGSLVHLVLHVSPKGRPGVGRR